MEEDTGAMEEKQNQETESEVAPALIAVHPSQLSVAVAVGSDLRIFDLQKGCPVSLGNAPGESLHKDSIRAIRYGAKGKIFVSAGDDKIVKVWSTDTWHCLYSVSSEKRVTAVAISDDGKYVCYADKFGIVWVVDLDDIQENQHSINKKALPVLSHYCSIITSLEFSPDGQFIITADRDFKIRVTVFPKKPLDGAHEIQCFCLGHTEFVSCLAFVHNQEYPQGFLVSGSGDSTVRLWDFISGSLLDTCDVGTMAGILQSNGGEEDNHPVVTGLSVNNDGSLIAVGVQSLTGVLLLSCNLSARTLSVAKVVSISEEAFIPTSLGTTISSELIWMVMGVSSLQGSDHSSLSRVRVISDFGNSKPQKGEPVFLEDKDIPGGEKLLEKLQGNLLIEKEVFSAAAEAVKKAMQNLMIKKEYSVERRDFRKRGRNDKKKTK